MPHRIYLYPTCSNNLLLVLLPMVILFFPIGARLAIHGGAAIIY